MKGGLVNGVVLMTAYKAYYGWIIVNAIPWKHIPLLWSSQVRVCRLTVS